MLERSKSRILPNGNFREFFLWRGGNFCVFKTGIPGGPDVNRLNSLMSINLIVFSVLYLFDSFQGNIIIVNAVSDDFMSAQFRTVLFVIIVSV